MTIQLRGVSTAASTQTNPTPISPPTGTLEDDLLLLVVAINLDQTPTTPDGWTAVPNGAVVAGANFPIYTFYKPAGASEPAVSVTRDGSGTPRMALQMVGWYSDTADPLVVDIAANQTNASSVDRTFPAVVTTLANCALACVANIAGSNASTPDAAMAEQWDYDSFVRCYGMTQVLVAAPGSTGTRVATGSTPFASHCVTIAVAEDIETIPAAPSGLSATATSASTIDLSFTDNSTDEAGFEIERSADGSTGWALISTNAANDTTFTDTGRAGSTQYFYRVRATNTAGGSAYTSVANAITFTDAPPPVALHLFLLNPEIVFSCRVNQASATYPLDEITWDGLIDGAYADVRTGMTMLLGSTLYGDEYGRQRVRGDATSTVLPVGRSSLGVRDGELTVADNAYITVLADYRVWSKIPWIADDGTINKDSEIAFVDQTIEPPPVANAGAAFAATISPATSLITVAFDGSASFATADGATITGWGWDLKDGTVTAGATNTANVTATFPAGFRFINLTVTDSNGKTMTSHRPIYARDPADDGYPGGCVTNFQIESHRISAMGQQLSLRIRQDIPAATWPDGTLVMLWDGEPESAADRSHMIMTGWHQTNPASISAERTGLLRDTTLQCLDVAGRLDTLPGFPQTIENDATPDKWSQMAGLNFDKFMHYLLMWDSTALEVADWTWSGTGAAYEYFRLVADGDSLYDQLERKATSICPDHHFVCNTMGQLAVNPDPLLQDTGDRTATIQATLTESDWSDIRYTAQRPPRVRQLWGEALLADPAEAIPLFCVAPGNSPSQGESDQRHSEQLTLSQDDLNAVTGHRYARLNAPQGLYAVQLAAGDDLSVEPADMTWVELTLSSDTAAQRGLAFTEARGLPKELSIRYSHERTGLVRTVEMTWERETSGSPAVTVIPPEAEPVDDGDDWTPPPITPAPVPEPIPETGVQTVGLITNLGHIYTTTNFQATPPTWTADTSLAADFGAGNEIYSFVVDPFSPLYRGLGSTVRGFAATDEGIWRIDDIFGTPTATEMYTFDDTTAGPHIVWWRSIAASFGRFQEDEADNPWIIVASYYASPTTRQGVYTVSSVDGGATWSALEPVNADDPDPYTVHVNPHNRIGLWLSPRTPGLAYCACYTLIEESDSYEESKVKVSTDWGETWVNIDLLPVFTLWNSLGGHIHVPWADNADESVVYNGYYHYIEGLPTEWTLHYGLMRSGSDISPTNASRQYGPREGLFGVRTYDGDRRYVAVAGFSNDSDDFDERDADNLAAVFLSEDYGNTWTMITSPVSVQANDVYPTQVAFGADSRDTIFIWGNQGYVAYSTNFGATVLDKTVASWSSNEGIVGFVGGE